MRLGSFGYGSVERTGILGRDVGAPDLSLVVPCYAEGAQVDRCVEALKGWAEARPWLAVEVVGVDDGSPDDTAERWQAWAQRWDLVQAVRMPENRGKGAALREGIARSTGARVAYLDADLAVGVEHLDALLAALDAGADVVVGRRAGPGASVERPQGAVRRWLGRRYLKFAQRVLGLQVSDITCGFKAFRGDLAREVFAAASAERWGIDAEVLLLAQQRGARIAEVPVVWRDGGRSAVRLVRDVLRSFRELLAARRRHGKARP
jgi:dolichyl-phosphate beta-glucosyltransferase